MTDGDAYLVARLVSAVFGRRRPSCAIAFFVLIVLGVIGVLLARADSLNEVAFPLIALSFLAALGVVEAVRRLRLRGDMDHPTSPPTSKDADDPAATGG